MSAFFALDIKDMHTKFGFYPRVEELTDKQLLDFMEFRVKFLEEELAEIRKALAERDWNAFVDGHIDLNVVSTGNIDLVGVDVVEAWNRVHTANMAKVVGIKANRPNPFGFPDLIKPPGFISPDHSDNIGLLAIIKDEKDSA